MKKFKKLLPILGIAAFGVTGLAGLSNNVDIVAVHAQEQVQKYVPLHTFWAEGFEDNNIHSFIRHRTTTFWDGEGAFRSFNATDSFLDSIHTRPERHRGAIRSPEFTQTGEYICFLFGGSTANRVNIFDVTIGQDIFVDIATAGSTCNMTFKYFKILESSRGHNLLVFIEDRTVSGYGGITFSSLQVNLSLEEVAKAFSVHKNNLATYNVQNLTGEGTYNDLATNWTLGLYNNDEYYREVREAEVLLTDADDDFEYDNNLVNWAFDQTYSTFNDGNRLTGFNFNDIHSDAHGKDWAENMPSNKSGNLYLNADRSGIPEDAKYRLVSNTFTLSGVGLISAKLGGNSAQLQLLDENNNILEHTGDANPHFVDAGVGNIADTNCRTNTMGRTYLDCSEHLGKKVKVAIADSRTGGGWGLAYFDDVKTNYATYPTFQIDVFTQKWGENPEYHAHELDVYIDTNSEVTPFEEAYNFYREFNQTYRTKTSLFSWCNLDLNTAISKYNQLSEAARAIVDASEDIDYGYDATIEGWYLRAPNKQTLGVTMNSIIASSSSNDSNTLAFGNIDNNNTSIISVMIIICIGALFALIVCKKHKHN